MERYNLHFDHLGPEVVHLIILIRNWFSLHFDWFDALRPFLKRTGDGIYNGGRGFESFGFIW